MPEQSFSFKPPPPFRLDYTAWVLRRHEANLIDIYAHGQYRRVLLIDGRPVTMLARQEGDRVSVICHWRGRSQDMQARVEPILRQMLGVDVDLSPYYRIAKNDKHLGPIVEKFRGAKPTRFPTPFEALLNAFSCQQLSLSFGLTLLNRLATSFGPKGLGDQHAAPQPEHLAEAKLSQLREMTYSTHKAQYILDTASQLRNGELDLSTLEAMPSDQAEAELRKLRGVGRWTAEYVLLRGLRRMDVFPADDVGGRKRLEQWFKLESLDYESTNELLHRWRPYEGLTYFHLLLEGLDRKGLLQETPAAQPATIYTIGHSTRSIEEFIGMLRAHGVRQVVDVRTVPRSRHNPQFDQEALRASLTKAGFAYVWMKSLGGLRHAKKDSPNTGWTNASFRGFADYMQTSEFAAAVEKLIEVAKPLPTAILCAEAVPWRCHRSLIADALAVRGAEVLHIHSTTTAKLHKLTPFAHVTGQEIVYAEPVEVA